jgi:23S rRNA pseudouridine2457 synthase
LTEKLPLILLNKPWGVLSSFTDADARRGEREDARETLSDYVDLPSVYPAGRLDYDSEGLLLLTQDGDLAHRLTHPRFKLTKTYWVQVEGLPTREALAQLEEGVPIKGGRTSGPARARQLPEAPELWPRRQPIRERKSIPTGWIELQIGEGRKRQVRQMTAAVGLPTLRLVRASVGPFRVLGIASGSWRVAEQGEMDALWSSFARSARRERRSGGRRSPR